MPRKSAKQTGLEIIMGVIAVVILVLVTLFRFIVENPWIIFIIVGIVVFAVWFNKREKEVQEQKDIEARKLEERKLQELLMQREKEKEEKEQKRIQAILSRKDDWGNELCQWMIDNNIDPYISETHGIMNKIQEWGQETCQLLLERRITIGMTVEMVLLAVGSPTNIDNKIVTTKDEKYRYVYGIPRQGATYIWFKNGKVTKFKQ